MRCPNCRIIHKDNKSMVVPCGKCEVCLDNRRRDYTVRLNLAFQKYNSVFFCTLTFENEFLPDSREECIVAHKLFMKRLRKQDKFGAQLKYFSVLEKGDMNGRFHWHMILFTNAVVTKETCLDYIYHAWHDPKTKEILGFVQCGYAKEGSASYLTKYLFKQDYKMLISRGLGFPEFNEKFLNQMATGVVHLNGFSYSIGNSIKNKLKRDNSTADMYLKKILKPEYQLKNSKEDDSFSYYFDVEKRKNDYMNYINNKKSQENKY